MPRLDLFSVGIFSLLTVFVAGAAMFLVSRVVKRAEGVGRCALSCAVILVGMLAYSLRLVIPGRLAILLPNLIMLAGLMILFDGVRAFRGHRRPTVPMALASGAFLAAHSYWLFVTDDINARTALFMFAISVWAAALLFIMVRNVPARDRLVYWPTGATIAVFGLAAVVRGLDAVGGPRIDFWNGRAVDFLFVFAANFCVCGCAIGLTMAINLKMQRETEILALFDSLTQLPNRRHFEEQLELAEHRASLGSGRIALIYCDLDDFKGINDRLGHEGGDQALRMVGRKLRELVDDRIWAARVGGDEFVLLLEDAPAREQIHQLITRITDAVDGDVRFGGRTAHVRISCGLAIYPEDVGSVSDLIRLGDAAMYMMKQHGRYQTL